MHYKPKSNAALQIAVGGLPPGMRVDIDPDVKVSAKTVRELLTVETWPDNLVVTTPDGRGDSCVKISRQHHASRTAPKPT